jgi:hypothetical protein
MVVARTWQHDDTPDMATTMKEIDRRLATAEEWGRTLRVLRGGASQDNDVETDIGGASQDNDVETDIGGDDQSPDQAPGGRYQ